MLAGGSLMVTGGIFLCKWLHSHATIIHALASLNSMEEKKHRIIEFWDKNHAVTACCNCWNCWNYSVFFNFGSRLEAPLLIPDVMSLLILMSRSLGWIQHTQRRQGGGGGCWRLGGILFTAIKSHLSWPHWCWILHTRNVNVIFLIDANLINMVFDIRRNHFFFIKIGEF